MPIDVAPDCTLDKSGDSGGAARGGDARLVSGNACVMQDLSNRLMTVRGTLPEDRNYGGGLAAYTDVSGSQPRMDALANIAAVDLANDDRVDPASVAVRFKRDERGVPKVYFRAAVRATGDEVTNA